MDKTKETPPAAPGEEPAKKASELHIETVKFPNGNQAKLVKTTTHQDPTEIIARLDISRPQALVMSIGGAAGMDEKSTVRLQQLYSRAIARAAANIGAAIIDGGTAMGVMQMMGKGVADRGRKSTLLGIAPSQQVSYPGQSPKPGGDPASLSALDANHSHFILVESDTWGDETDMMCAITKSIANRQPGPTPGTNGKTTPETDKAPKAAPKPGFFKRMLPGIDKQPPSGAQMEVRGEIPVVTILANGGAIAKAEVLYSVRQGWPILVIAGSGRLADEIAGLIHEDHEFIEDPAMAEIIEEGAIYTYDIEGPIEGMERLVIRLLREDATLRMAWEQFAIYDINANRQRDQFQITQRWILVLGVLGTTFAVTKTTMANGWFVAVTVWVLSVLNYLPFIDMTPEEIQQFANSFFDMADGSMHAIIVVIPILTGLLVAGVNRFSPGNKWILLRSSAENIKRHIYRYRTRATIYSDKETAKTSREAKLSNNIQGIRSHLAQTETNLSALRPYHGPIPPKYGAADGDDGFSFLTPEKYVAFRLDDQLVYYKKQTVKLEKKHQLFQWLVLIMGGFGTLLAAFNLDIWIAVTTALITAFTTYIEYSQVESKLIKFNQAATDLANVRGWWMALSSEEQANQKNIDMLVGHTERFLEVEFSGWMQEMQEALEELRAAQEKDDTTAGSQETDKNVKTNQAPPPPPAAEPQPDDV